MTPDATVPVAASRSDHPHHALAIAWLSKSLTAASVGAAFTLMPMTVASFLRTCGEVPVEGLGLARLRIRRVGLSLRHSGTHKVSRPVRILCARPDADTL